MAKKNIQQLSQKAEKHIEKAERVFEKGATKFMQEAENMFAGNPGSVNRDDASSRGPKPSLTQEEEELQWALRASLEEAQRSRSRAEAGDPHPKGKRKSQSNHSNAKDLPQKVMDAQARSKVAEERLNRQLAMQAKKSKELNELNAKNQEVSAVAERLAQELYEAEAELMKLKQTRQDLEEQLGKALSMQVCKEPFLKKKLQELEVQVQAKVDAAANLEEPSPHQKKEAVEQKEADTSKDEAATSEACEEPSPLQKQEAVGQIEAATSKDEAATSEACEEASPGQKEEALRQIEAATSKDEAATSEACEEASPGQKEEAVEQIEAATSKDNAATSEVCEEPSPQQKDEAVEQIEAATSKDEATTSEVQDATPDILKDKAVNLEVMDQTTLPHVTP